MREGGTLWDLAVGGIIEFGDATQWWKLEMCTQFDFGPCRVGEEAEPLFSIIW